MIILLLIWFVFGFLSYKLKEKYLLQDETTLLFCVVFGWVSFIWIGTEILVDYLDDWRNKHGRA